MIKFIMGILRPAPLTLEAWAYRNSERATPDEIIAAYLIKNIAKEFENWSIMVAPDEPDAYSSSSAYAAAVKAQQNWVAANGDVNRILMNGTKKIRYKKLKIGARINFTVNGVVINDKDGIRIIEGYDEIKRKFDAAKAAAEKAALEMKLAEEKWNLAESLLGMQRNQFGALVPIKEG